MSVTAPAITAIGARKPRFIMRKNVERIEREFPADWPKVHQKILSGQYLVVEEVPCL